MDYDDYYMKMLMWGNAYTLCMGPHLHNSTKPLKFEVIFIESENI